MGIITTNSYDLIHILDIPENLRKKINKYDSNEYISNHTLVLVLLDIHRKNRNKIYYLFILACMMVLFSFILAGMMVLIMEKELLVLLPIPQNNIT